MCRRAFDASSGQSETVGLALQRPCRLRRSKTLGFSSSQIALFGRSAGTFARRLRRSAWTLATMLSFPCPSPTPSGILVVRPFCKKDASMTGHATTCQAPWAALVVDDDAGVRQSLRLCLEAAGARVLGVATGRAALEALDRVTSMSSFSICGSVPRPGWMCCRRCCSARQTWA